MSPLEGAVTKKSVGGSTSLRLSNSDFPVSKLQMRALGDSSTVNAKPICPFSPHLDFLCFQSLPTVANCNSFVLITLQQWGGGVFGGCSFSFFTFLFQCVGGGPIFQFRFSNYQLPAIAFPA